MTQKTAVLDCNTAFAGCVYGKRNTVQNYTFFLTGEALDEDSERVHKTPLTAVCRFAAIQTYTKHHLQQSADLPLYRPT